jgi:autotransporter-associated beta strand protein/T5SS/PEP-CTERM-associated repeat protein
MKPKYPSRTTSASLLTNIFFGLTIFSTSARAGDVFWDGSTDNNWNTADNWSADRVPSKAIDSDNAIINTLTNFPVINADLAEIPRDIKVGTAGTGRVDHRAGSASAGSESQGRDWVVIGEDAGEGTYNLADTGATGGTLTGFGTGSGSLTTQQLRLARKFSSNVPTGEMAVNTTGTVKVFNDMLIGDGGSGTLKWDAGTLDRSGDSGWMVVGQGGASGNGTFNISGGTINASNDTNVGLGSESTGQLNLSGGTYNAGGIWVGRSGGTGTWTVSGANTQLTSSGEVYVGGESGSNGTLQVSAGTVSINNWFNVGRDGGTGGFEMSGGTMTVQRELRIGFGSGGTGDLQLSGGAIINAATVSEHIVIGGNSGSGTATMSGTGTELNSTNELRVGNEVGSTGELSISGGTITTGSWLSIGRDGATGTMTISGDAVVDQGLTDVGSRLELTSNNKPSTATLSLDGGTLVTNGFANSGGGTTNIFLNGGLIVSSIDNESFLQGMTSVTIEAGGARIDSDGSNIAINQSMVGLAGDGGLLKSGFGTLRLNGANTFAGTTTVEEGEVAGTGSISGALLVQNGGTVAPGAPVGTFTAGNTTIEGNYSCEIDGFGNDLLTVNGALNLSAATDALTFLLPGAGTTQPVYIIANYTTLTGTFDTVNNLPSGYTLTHSYNGGNQIAIVSSYLTWIATFFPGETNPAIIGTEADPDGDGQPNKIEFALGADPADGANNAKIYQFTEDSSDAGTAKELLLTIAVRDGAGLNPVFSPAIGGSPTATQDGVTYTIQGGVDPVSFTGSVSVVNTVATGLPAAPAGYEYRTFSLDGSDGLPARGFMRVSITP